MGVDRRKFLKIAGLGAVGLACKPATDLFAKVVLSEHSPLAGKRLAMVIDLRKCRQQDDCTACIDACHQVHNVPTEFDTAKHEVKWIWKDQFDYAFPEQDNPFVHKRFERTPVLMLCNHCDDPPCVKVCPTQATWKRPEDGIVMMDWHRCIGCRYCIAACPYGSRSFNWGDPREGLEEINPDFPTRMRGVVEKCTFCEERVVKGLLPVCVEACPVNAITFGDLDDPRSKVRRLVRRYFTLRRKPELGTHPQIYYIV